MHIYIYIYICTYIQTMIMIVMMINIIAHKLIIMIQKVIIYNDEYDISTICSRTVGTMIRRLLLLLDANTPRLLLLLEGNYYY